MYIDVFENVWCLFNLVNILLDRIVLWLFCFDIIVIFRKGSFLEMVFWDIDVGDNLVLVEFNVIIMLYFSFESF